MSGGPSHIDLFDYKPRLRQYHGQELPGSVRMGQRITGMTAGQRSFPCVAPMFRFAQHGQCGAWVSELLPHMAGCIDDLAMIKSVHTEAINHDPAITYICTGHQLPGRPSLGAWLSYGLGTENANLPAFVVLSPSANSLWTSSGFLPAEYQGTLFNNAETDPEKMIRFLRNKDLDATTQRKQLDAIQALNRAHADSFGADDFLEVDAAVTQGTEVPVPAWVTEREITAEDPGKPRVGDR